MERESSLGGRLRRLMEEEGLSYEQLGERLGMNPQTLNRYVLGRREPKVSTATAIAMTLGVDPLWLQGYSVPRRRGAPEEAAWGTREHTIPILGVIRAGAPILAVEDIEGYIPFPQKAGKELFALHVSGLSMRDAGILDGDYVVAERVSTADDGEIVVAMIDDEATVKRLYREKEGVRLQPANPDFQPIYSDHASVLGKVIAVVRYY